MSLPVAKERISVGILRDHAHNFGRKPERVAHSDHPANAGAEADWDIDGVEVADGGEKLVSVARNPDDEIAVERWREHIAALAGDRGSVLLGLIEVAAVFNELGAEGAHCRILLGRIAVRHHDRRGNSGALRRKGKRLAMIAARGRDDALDLRPLASQPIHVDHAAAHLERANRRVILMLDEDIGARAFRKARPRVLRRRRHGRSHDRQCGLNFREGEKGRGHDEDAAFFLFFHCQMQNASAVTSTMLRFSPHAPPKRMTGRSLQPT